MKGFLIKDFRLLLGQKQFYIAVLGIGILLTGMNGLGMGVAYITGLLAYFTISTISYDDVENGMAFLMTLPATRRQYVRGKYLYAFILSIAGCMLAIIVGLGFCIANSYLHGIQEVLLAAGVMLPVCWLMLAILIPIQIKFGAEKGRLAVMATFACTGIVIFALMRLLELTGIGFALLNLDVKILMLMGVIAYILILLASYLICVRIILKKEY